MANITWYQVGKNWLGASDPTELFPPDYRLVPIDQGRCELWTDLCGEGAKLFAVRPSFAEAKDVAETIEKYLMDHGV